MIRKTKSFIRTTVLVSIDVVFVLLCQAAEIPWFLLDLYGDEHAADNAENNVDHVNSKPLSVKEEEESFDDDDDDNWSGIVSLKSVSSDSDDSDNDYADNEEDDDEIFPKSPASPFAVKEDESAAEKPHSSQEAVVPSQTVPPVFILTREVPFDAAQKLTTKIKQETSLYLAVRDIANAPLFKEKLTEKKNQSLFPLAFFGREQPSGHTRSLTDDSDEIEIAFLLT